MYAAAADVLPAIGIGPVPNELEADLCERTYGWVIHKGISVKRITAKDAYRKEHKRSPDDGDGFALAVAPDHVFLTTPPAVLVHGVTSGWSPRR